MVVLLVLLTVVILLAVDALVRHRRVALQLVSAGPVFDPLPPGILAVPSHTYLARTHTWARPGSDGVLRVGATGLPLHALGRPDALDLPAIGSTMRAGDPLATLRRGERRLTLRSPVDGVVESINRGATHRPEQISDQPFENGWFCSIRPNNMARSLRGLLVAEEAAVWMRRELGRLRDVISGVARGSGESVPLLTDGGLPLEGFASRMDAEAWNQVARRFFDSPPAR